MSVPAQSSSFRLSPQQALALGRRNAPAVVQCVLELASPVDETALVSALRRVVARHESLRTTFVTPAGAKAPVAQTVHDELEPAFSRADAPADEAGLDAALAAEAAQLDLAAGPSLRALVLDGGDEPLLVLTALAACADAASLAMVAEGIRSGAEPDPEAEPIQHADYAEWRHELRDGDDPDAPQGIAFWSAAAEAPAPVRILFGDPATPPSGARERLAVPLDAALFGRLDAAAERSRVGLETLVHGAWLAVLFRLSGAEELATVRLGDGRSQPDLADALGPYAQPLPLRVAIEAETSVPELLDRIARASDLGERWQDYATDGELAAACAAATAGFVFAPAAPLRRLTMGTTGARLELALGGRSGAELRYDAAAYDARDAAEIAAGLDAVLRALADDPARAVVALPITSAQRRAELLAAAAGPAPRGDATAIHLRVERHAQATPDAPAVVGDGTTLSYRELDEAATRLAHELQARGADGDAPVAICLPRTPAALVAVLAAMKVGGGYLPLHREHPPARLAHQLTESGARVVVTQLDLLDRLPALEATAVVCVDRDAGAIAAQPTAGLGGAAGAEDLAYVMYTSGSTGLPKGVAVTHGNLANYTDALAERIGAEPGWQYALVSELSTDLGNTAVFPALATGGTVHLIEPRTAMDGLAFSAYAAAHALDVMKITPTHLRALLAGGHGFLPRRWLVLGGEALSWGLVAEVRATGAGCRLLNHYGPTETTIGATTFEVPGELSRSATVPIGRALAGGRTYVLDARLDPVPEGVPGELCIGGAGVARGYVGRAEETELRFVIDPCGGRMYRTGDRVRRHRDGAIEFLGRVDQQVKIRGYRVEPGEVESALARHPAVREAAVLAHAPEGEEARLVAYVVGPDAQALAELPSFVAETLPEYMVPARFVPIEVIPLTPSGKIDRQALPDPDTVAAARTDAFVAPRDDLERDIAAIWAELLGLPEVGVTDDFFALGGHSLLATQAIMRIRRAFGDIPLGALFNAPTVAALAETIRARSGTQSAGR